MTPEELVAHRKALRMTQQALADALGVHQVTVARWETGAREIPPFLALALAQLKRQSQSSETSGSDCAKTKGEAEDAKE